MSLFAPETIEVACDIDIEQTQRSFHAHAVPDGIDIRPGDTVLVHGLPGHVDFGEHLIFRSTATVTRAGALPRLWTKIAQLFELTELFEVGFQPLDEADRQPKYPRANPIPSAAPQWALNSARSAT